MKDQIIHLMETNIDSIELGIDLAKSQGLFDELYVSYWKGLLDYLYKYRLLTPKKDRESSIKAMYSLQSLNLWYKEIKDVPTEGSLKNIRVIYLRKEQISKELLYDLKQLCPNARFTKPKMKGRRGGAGISALLRNMK